jgi:hypothetical protein
VVIYIKEFTNFKIEYILNIREKKGNTTKGKVRVDINQKAIGKDLKIAGFNLLVTSELKMKADDI